MAAKSSARREWLISAEMGQSGVALFLPQESLVRLMTGDPSATDADPALWAWGQTVFIFWHRPVCVVTVG